MTYLAIGGLGALQPLGISEHEKMVQELESLRTDLFRRWPVNKEDYSINFMQEIVGLMTRLTNGFMEVAAEAISAARNLFVWKQIEPFRNAVKRTYEKPREISEPWFIRWRVAKDKGLPTSTIIYVGTDFRVWVKRVMRDLIAGWGGLGYIEGVRPAWIRYMAEVMVVISDAVNKIGSWFTEGEYIFEIKPGGGPKKGKTLTWLLAAAAGGVAFFLYQKRRR